MTDESNHSALDKIALKRQGRASGWTDERRAAQAERIRASRPWRHSTGPRTQAGKARAAMNALKHSLRSVTVARLRLLLWRQQQMLDRFTARIARHAMQARFNRGLAQLFEILKKPDTKALFYSRGDGKASPS